ncbi:GumC family protein [Azospirillum rugosum]|nr:Wzz/FepE/Etk N-terminal domain-containing protein [Azospirillum rugosum]MDQ0525227.1 capsular exopolysaccharide synthesis family protein [Azospirillum rugosum]
MAVVERVPSSPLSATYSPPSDRDLTVTPWLSRMIRMYWQQKYVLLASVALFVGIGYLYVNSKPPLYRATATLMLDPHQRTVIDVAQVVTPFRPDELSIESEIQVLQSADIALKVIAKAHLDQLPEFSPAAERALAAMEESEAVRRMNGAESPMTVAALLTDLRDLWAEARRQLDALWWGDAATDAEASNPARDARRDQTVMLERFESALQVGPLGHSRVIGVTFTSQDPVLAATVANTIVETYLAQQASGRLKDTVKANDWLEQRAHQFRGEAEQAQKAYLDRLTKAQPTAGVDVELLRDQLLQLNRSIAQAEADYKAVRDRRERMEKLAASGDLAKLAAESKSENLEAIRLQTVILERRRAELTRQLGNMHPTMSALNAQIAAVRQSMNGEAQRLVSDTAAEEGAMKSRLEALQENAKRTQERLRTFQEAKAEISTLEREARSSEEIYNTFLTRYKGTSAAPLVQPEAWAVSTALPPADPALPRGRVILILAGLFGLGLGGAGVTLRELLQTGMRSNDEIEEQCGLRGLGLSPSLPRRVASRRDVVWYVLENPRSPFAESIRIIISNTLALLQPCDRGGVLSVGSAWQHEGKSTVVASAATLLAMSRFRVLVIDGDIRKPSQHDLFRLPNGPGLSEYMSGMSDDMPVPQISPETGIHLLTSGMAGITDARAPLYLNHGDRLQRLVDWARHYYDIILIDMPPCMPVVDARIIASLSDRCIFVSRWRSTPISKIKYSLRELKAAGADIAGLALVQVDVRKHAASEYGDSGIYFKYGRRRPREH